MPPQAHIQCRPRTPSLQRALVVLDKFDPSEVLAWLRILRCLEPGYQHNGASGEVTAAELEAASSLKVCTDDQVRYWLKPAKRNAVARTSPTSPLLLSTNQSLDQSASRHQAKSFGCNNLSSVASSSLYNGKAGQSTLPSSLSDGTARSQKPITKESFTASSQRNAHDHWCTICEQPKHYGTCDGWKRHMREHENMYPCMPEGPLCVTESGDKCCFCDQLHPDQKHLDSHSVSSCRGGTETMHKYSRRLNLITHIKKVHRASDTFASKLADEWQIRQKNQRRYFSCGFCVHIFSTLKAQINHVDREHWSRLHPFSAWNPNNLILGLLLQSEVSEAWQALLARHDIRSDSSALPSWNPTTIKDLQLKLEISQDSAQDLVHMAFMQSSYYPSHQVELRTASHHSYEDSVTMEDTPTPQDAAINPNVLYSFSSEIVALYRDAPGQSKPSHVGSQCGSLQTIDAVSDSFSASLLDEGTGYSPDTFMDPFELLLNDTDNTTNLEHTRDAPWSPYATMKTQTDDSETPPYQTLSGEATQDSNESPYGPMHLKSPHSQDAHPFEPYAHGNSTFDTDTRYNSLPSTADTGPVMTTNAPVRKRPPHVVLGPKRKRSPITSSGNRLEQSPAHVIDMGNNSQYRERDDHVRSRRRVRDDYTDHA